MLAAIDVRLLRTLAIVAFAIQLAGLVAAVMTRVMLHADGSFFVYAISAGEPWDLKWGDIPARAAIYYTTVWPTYLLSQSLHLSPLQISDVNTLFFYGWPVLTFALACAMVWRSHPKYIFFPVAQFALSSAFCYGFPSEIILAPGFLWICLFLLLRSGPIRLLFLPPFLALVFCHELALPAAMAAAWLAIKQSWDERGNSRRSLAIFYALTLGIVCVFALFLAVRVLGGGEGSDFGIIYVFDLRRLLNNPTLWIALFLAALFWLAPISSSTKMSRTSLGTAILIGLAAPVAWAMAFPDIGLERGRYDSRTFVAIAMLTLTVAFGCCLLRKEDNRTDTATRFGRRALLFLTIGLAVTTSSAAMFLREWTVALNAMDKVVGETQSNKVPPFIKYADARRLMTPEEASANDRDNFRWTLVFRSAVLADGLMPSRVVYGNVSLKEICSEGQPPSEAYLAVPASLKDRINTFTCNFEGPPPANTISRRFFRYIRELRQRLF